MKLSLALRRLWASLPPQTWPETFMVIAIQLLLVLALAFLIDCVKGLLP